jgi:hypothetical protein
MLNGFRKGVDAHAATNAAGIICFVFSDLLAFWEARKEGLVYWRVERSQYVQRFVARTTEAMHRPRRNDDASWRMQDLRVSTDLDADRTFENQDLFFVGVPTRGTPMMPGSKMLSNPNLLGPIDQLRLFTPGRHSSHYDDSPLCSQACSILHTTAVKRAFWRARVERCLRGWICWISAS